MALDFIKKNHSSASLLFCNGEEKYDPRDNKIKLEKKSIKSICVHSKNSLGETFLPKRANQWFSCLRFIRQWISFESFLIF